jgi:cell division septum initiation protein DivIVA
MNRHLKHSRLGASLMATALMASCMIEAAGATDVGPPRQPVKYLVKEKSLIGNQLYEAGATVEYDGLPADNLEPTCDEGRARAAEYERSNKARVANLIAANQESAVGDPEAFAAAFAKQLAEERAQHQAQLAAQQETMAKMLEMQQASATQLAEAAKNMATLAAALVQAQTAPAAPAIAAAPPETPPTDTDTKSTEKAGKAKG